MNDALKTTMEKIPPIRWLVLLGRTLHDWHKKQQEREYQYYKGLSPEQYPEALKKWYKKNTGKELNLENPQTFNEKIQWMKLYDSTPLKTKLADKYLVRDWVKGKIGEEYLIPLLGVYDNFDDIDFDALPDKFVIKTNHGCHWCVIVTDKTKFDAEDAREKVNSWLETNFAFMAGLELQYKNIVPKIIIEEYIENSDNDLYDYKFWCFDGKVQFIAFMTNRKKERKVTIYDVAWNRMPFAYGKPQHEENVEKPDNLEQMIKLAEGLAIGFSHVRVDFYRLNDGTIKFGEMTFTPSSGVYKWNPPEYDKIIGDLIKLPTDEK